MDLNAVEIELTATALHEALAGGKVRGVFTPKERDRLILEVRRAEHTHWLLISMIPGMCFIGLVADKIARAPVAHTFAMLMRGHVVNVGVGSVSILNNDRIVSIAFSSRFFNGALICEMTGHSSNLFLVDGDGLVLGAFHPKRARRRNLEPGQPYSPPPRRIATTIATSRFTAEEFAGTFVSSTYETAAGAEDAAICRHRLLQVVRTAQKRTDRLVTNLTADLQNAARADILRRDAYALQTHLREIPRGAAQFATTDFEGNALLVSLDPKFDATTNMSRMFDKARRLTRAREKIAEKRNEALTEQALLEQWHDQIASAPDDELDRWEARVFKKFPGKKPGEMRGKTGLPTRQPFREFTISGNRVARVGKGAVDNDALTLHFSNPWDLWLHVRGAGGSHVIVTLKRGEIAGGEVLIDAAHLAAHFSSLRNEDIVEVTYTDRRHVQKSRGAPAGQVRLLKEKTVVLRVDRIRLARLLKNEPVSDAESDQ